MFSARHQFTTRMDCVLCVWMDRVETVSSVNESSTVQPPMLSATPLVSVAIMTGTTHTANQINHGLRPHVNN